MGVTQTPVVLRADDLRKEYQTGKDLLLPVLKGVSLEIRPAEVVIVVGPSGSGKSTLLHILGGIDRPTAGKVVVDSQDIFALSENERAAFRNTKLGFIFQFHHLLPEFTALENVAMPALVGGLRMRDVRGRAVELLSSVGLSDRVDHKPNELSGGEQQRVAVARALMNTPLLVL
ncbi:MAG: ABC transporter ATP-binding protein, partial [Bacteroidota bacterium]